MVAAISSIVGFSGLTDDFPILLFVFKSDFPKRVPIFWKNFCVGDFYVFDHVISKNWKLI